MWFSFAKVKVGFRWLLPLVVLSLLGAVIFKSQQQHRHLTVAERLELMRQRPVPFFTLVDQHSKPLRLERYVSRHKLLIVFYDAKVGADKDPLLATLRQDYTKLTSWGEKILAISTATPYANRQAIEKVGEFPFPLLSDVDYSAQVAFEVVRGDPPQTLPSVFLVDRLGIIRWSTIGYDTPPTTEFLREKLNRLR